ncbi:hypothetical protein WR25_14639 isoform B [Diploscapter pachys]|uniref:peptidylprolyl isomerase n=1 Tax=Diploscapter pachys TaxID=2018661 RepID=A0A2A2LJE6_9BILA|nr:hypothetical protein WR25_14639 isoform B [Diploscapter pachys]
MAKSPEEVPVETKGDEGRTDKAEKIEEPVKKKTKKAEVEPETTEKTLKYEETYLRSVPSASQYEKSFMHRDTISHVLATQTDFIVTASIDGHLKFWKKKHGEGIEFVKHFRCHLHAFSHICCNFNGTLLATVCQADNSVKIFDVENFDMINMLKFDFSPKTAAFIHQASDVVPYLAISDAKSGRIVVVDAKSSATILNPENSPLDKLHSAPVTHIDYSTTLDVAISTDARGFVEMWMGFRKDLQLPTHLKWKCKTDTDLYEFLKTKSTVTCLKISPSGLQFATMSSDKKVRIFDILTGKLIKTIDENLGKYTSEAKENRNFGLQNMEWNRRVACEKEMDKDDDERAKQPVAFCWDYTSNYILYPSIIGIKVYNITTDKVVRTVGKEETIRFLAVSLCKAVPDVRARLQGAATTIETEAAENPNLNKPNDPDPLFACTAYKKNRFYLFTNAEPFAYDDEEDENATSRDVFNEKPKKEDQITAVEADVENKKLSEFAILHTSMGDIRIHLFGEECSKTVENFCTHSRRGYYNGLTFHRVIKSFMVQTGDPTGKGTGGQSIWGADFEDEFHPRLRHDRPFRVSMANAGPNSNGSQFFITVCPADWLDGKNTLFGEVKIILSSKGLE